MAVAEKKYTALKSLKVYKSSTSQTPLGIIEKGAVFQGTDYGRGRIRISKMIELGKSTKSIDYKGKYAEMYKNSVDADELPSSESSSGPVVSSNTKTYKVTSNAIVVYGGTQANSKIIGRLSKDTEFSAKDLGREYLEITSVKLAANSSITDFKGKFIKRTDLENMQTVSDTGTTYDSTTETGDTEADGDGGGDLGLVLPEAFFIDANFAQTYTTGVLGIGEDYSNAETHYRNELEALSINDIRGVLGIPHQFLPTTDVRIDSIRDKSVGNDITIGRVYGDKIIKQMPLLLLTPGVPSFMASFSEEQKGIAIKNLIDNKVDTSDLDSLVNSTSGKYYILRYAYTEYFYYVNAMLRAAAVFLGIDGETVNGNKLGSFNWLYYTTDPGNETTEEGAEADTSVNTDIFGSSGLHKFLGPYKGCIAMYADCGNSVDDSFSNSTTTSTLAGTLNSLSDSGREMNFLLGNGGALANISLSKLAGQEDLLDNMKNMTDMVHKALGNNGILSNILGKAQTILAGGRVIFPEIWSDSSFSRSYSCKLKLVSPSGDKLSVYLNILVPIYHILALTLPRQASGGDGRTDGQAYFSPFLVRGFCKGLFNIDMGIITDLSISKGAEGEWTIDGIPTVAEVSFSIKDMYDGMFMSKATDIADKNILSNTTELDYIANSCGVNINDQAIGRTLKMYLTLGFLSGGSIKDRIQIGIFGNIQQFFNQKIHNIFGYFD